MLRVICDELNLSKPEFFNYIKDYKKLEFNNRCRLDRLHPLIEPVLSSKNNTPLWLKNSLNREEFFSLINFLNIEIGQNVFEYKELHLCNTEVVPRLYVRFSYNNSKFALIDEKGNLIRFLSAGNLGFKGNKRSTSFAAEMCIKMIVGLIVQLNIKKIDLYLTGLGEGRKILSHSLKDVNIRNIVDVTSAPHNGCRPSKRRRL